MTITSAIDLALPFLAAAAVLIVGWLALMGVALCIGNRATALENFRKQAQADAEAHTAAQKK